MPMATEGTAREGYPPFVKWFGGSAMRNYIYFGTSICISKAFRGRFCQVFFRKLFFFKIFSYFREKREEFICFKKCMGHFWL